MNYNDALNTKLRIGEVYQIEGEPAKVMIAPLNGNDFQRYIDDYLDEDFTDEDAKKYSTYGEFKVCAIWTDGASISVKDLP